MPTPIVLVFSTPELLEAILLHLSPQHLLRAQLISRTFHSTIGTSPALQRALFFRSDPSIPSTSWTLNPLLRKHFLPFFVTPGDGVSMPGLSALHMLDWAASEKMKAAFLRADASWRRMLLIQPPPMDLHVASATDMQGGRALGAAEPLSFAPGGVTMGLVYDIAESFVSGDTSFEQFGLAIQGLESGTVIRLHLESVMQCCVDTPKESTMVSAGAASEREVRRVRWIERRVEGREARRRLVWNTDGAEQGEGVGKHEWDEWRRVRAAIGDPMSDVRGG